MIKRTFDITARIEHGQIPFCFQCVQGDKDVYTVHIRITDGGQEIDYNQVSSATITFALANGSVVQSAPERLSISSNGITYKMGTSEISCPGKVTASIQLFGSDGARLTTARFQFEVIADLITPSAVQSDSRFPILQQLLAEVQELKQDIVNLQIPDGSVMDAKLSDAAGQIKARFASHLADIAAHGAHKNILINYDFRRPVNQRGSTSYAVGTSPTYTIDRWRAASTGSGTVTVNSGYITIQSISGETYINQEIDDYNLYKGKTVTFSAKVNGLSGSGQAYILIYDGVSESRLNIASNGYVSITTTISASASTLFVRVAAYSGYSANFECVKLEMGYFSTLEGDPPANYGEQLALCQRYFVAVNAFGIAYATPAFAIAFSNTTARALLHLPAPMRLANPTVTMKGSNWVLTQTTSGAGLSVTAMTVASNESAANVGAIMLELTSSGLTTGSAYRLEAKADATCDIWISAEI